MNDSGREPHESECADTFVVCVSEPHITIETAAEVETLILGRSSNANV